MSSTYRILCLSHDPVIVLDQEFQSGDGGLGRVEAAVAAGVGDHPNCDLLIGRYSYPLIEVGCPSRTNHAGAYHPHSTQWVDAIWLRLLALAQQAPEGSVNREVAGRADRCWSPDRLARLRFELGIEAHL